MTPTRASQIKKGDTIIPHPTWNKTERPNNHLPREAEVLSIRQGQSQTGYLFTVKDMGGKLVELDAGWFL